MNGIAIIIPNADFTGSPLGKVTKAETVEDKAMRVVNTYASKIGTTTYNTALKNMVVSLMNEGLWDKVTYLYPMLGTTLAQKLVSLKDDCENGFVGNNATAITDGISFAKREDYNYEDVVAGASQKIVPSPTVLTVSMCVKPMNTTTWGNVYGFIGHSSSKTVNIATQNSTGTANWYLVGGEFYKFGAVGNVKQHVSMLYNNGQMSAMINGVNDGTSYVNSDTIVSSIISNAIGCSWGKFKTGSTNYKLTNQFDGELYVFAAAFTDNMAKFDEIIRTFADAVK